MIWVGGRHLMLPAVSNSIHTTLEEKKRTRGTGRTYREAAHQRILMVLHPRSEGRNAYPWVGWRRLLRKWVCWTFLLESNYIVSLLKYGDAVATKQHGERNSDAS